MQGQVRVPHRAHSPSLTWHNSSLPLALTKPPHHTHPHRCRLVESVSSSTGLQSTCASAYPALLGFPFPFLYTERDTQILSVATGTGHNDKQDRHSFCSSGVYHIHSWRKTKTQIHRERTTNYAIGNKSGFTQSVRNQGNPLY